jgi:hypothetical protein
MKHEILFLNSRRAYVRVEDTWYDTEKEHNPKVGQGFLLGIIKEVLSFEQYKELYPESKTEMFYEVVDKTHTGGFIRKVSDKKMMFGEYNRVVQYAVNPMQPALISKKDSNLN